MSLGAVANGQHYNIPGGGGGPPASTLALKFDYRFYPIVVWLIWLFN